MATDYAPDALVRAGREADKEIPGCTFSGVLGDKNHTYGYHRGRNVLPKNDYSVLLSLDKLGPSGAASALDLKFTDAQMKVVTARLRKSALDPNDPRMEPVREFYGTLNGTRVFGLIKSGLATPWVSSTSDKSHLWHVHISFFRKFANDYKAIRGVIDVMKGVPWKSSTSAPKPAPVVPTKPVVPPVKPTTHKVIAGDTVSGLAKKYGISIDNLVKWNNIQPNMVIRVGNILRLTSPGTPAPVPPKVSAPVTTNDAQARAFWSKEFRRYFAPDGGERPNVSMAHVILSMDAAIHRIEEKLAEREIPEGEANEDGTIPPPA